RAERERLLLLVLERAHDHPAVRPRPERDPGRAVDGHGQDEAVVVVGVLADHVDTPGRAHDVGGGGPEPLGEAGPDSALERHGALLRILLPRRGRRPAPRGYTPRR